MVCFVATKKPITPWLSLNSRLYLARFSPASLALICVNAFYKPAQQTALLVRTLSFTLSVLLADQTSHLCLFNSVLNL